jgi:ABC-type bacteriocin/lantibiotic exporter with double-glycine peptidase domain
MMTTFVVDLVPQQTAMSCWAASVTMIQSWAQQTCIDPATLTDIPGFQDAYERNGLDLTSARNALTTWGLVTEAPQDYTAQGFLDLLNQYGPIFIAANVGTDSQIANHARVITGFDMDQDTVYINDPWGANMSNFVPSNPGQQYTMTYEALLQQMDSLASAIYKSVENNDPTNPLTDLAFVAHLPQRPANI